MHILTGRELVGCLLIAAAVAFSTSCQTAGEQTLLACGEKNEFERLKIKTHSNHAPKEVQDKYGNADKVHTCPGDAVRWELKDYKFVITFKRDSPFEWKRQEAIDIGKDRWGVIGIVTNVSPKEVDHEYSVEVVGYPPVLDPIIIVDK